MPCNDSLQLAVGRVDRHQAFQRVLRQVYRCQCSHNIFEVNATAF